MTFQWTIPAVASNTPPSSTGWSARRRPTALRAASKCSRLVIRSFYYLPYRVLPYIIDLGSSNGTYLNNTRIEPQRYYELKEKDVVKFGYSSREYVLLHENSEDDA